ncbi:MAG: hypothetical protein AAB601_03445 [Patescibacteria group bacterium]
MKLWHVGAVIGVVAILVVGVWRLLEEKRTVEAEVAELQGSVRALAEENASLLESIEYFKDPRNLVKELKSQFNYREEGERLIIIPASPDFPLRSRDSEASLRGEPSATPTQP